MADYRYRARERKNLQSFRSCETYGWVPVGKVLAGCEVVQAGVPLAGGSR